ncbi:MAG: hypothetical protein ACE5GV_09630 [Candidatus Scalindua sp.]
MAKITKLIRFSVSKVLLPAIFTVALLVAFVSIGGNHARAQTAEQTVTDLLGTVSIPGLDSLPVSNLQSTDSYKSVDVTVHGQTATLVVFKPTDAGKNVVAVIPDNFSLSDFVPLPSTYNTPILQLRVRMIAVQGHSTWMSPVSLNWPQDQRKLTLILMWMSKSQLGNRPR